MDIKGISRTMTTEKRFLSQGDVEKLMADPSAETRARTGEKIAMEYERGWARLSGAERDIAEDIFRTLVRDVETRVLKDILAAGNQRKVYNSTSGTPSSVIAPAIVIEELELNKPEREFDKLPILKRPDQRAD